MATFGDGSSALRTFRKDGADLIVIDLLLPGMNGFELSRRMLEADPKLRILAISTECDALLMRMTWFGLR